MYSFYETATGRIRGTVSSTQNTEEAWLDSYPGCALVDGLINGNTYYMVGGESQARPEQDITVSTVEISADGVDEAALSGFAEGTEIFVNGVSAGTIDADGEFSFSTSVEGTFAIKATLFPYLDWEVTINATA